MAFGMENLEADLARAKTRVPDPEPAEANTSEQFQRLMANQGVACSMSRSGNVWDNAAMESFFSSMKTEHIAHKGYRTGNQVRADLFDYIECFYNPQRRHSTIGYLSPMELEWIAAAG